MSSGCIHNKIYTFSRNTKASLRLTKEACADSDECFFTRFLMGGVAVQKSGTQNSWKKTVMGDAQHLTLIEHIIRSQQREYIYVG